jgi:hypothetical protein
MSQTKQQKPGAAPTRVRKDLEFFWRIIAGLMLVIIAWIAWVLYQIAPRSVATPLAYESQIKSPGTQQPATGAAGTTASPQPTAAAPAAQPGAAGVPQPSPEAAAAALATDEAQAGARTGAHQSSADGQASVLEKREEQLKQEEQFRRERLKLSTEIATPPVEK